MLLTADITRAVTCSGASRNSNFCTTVQARAKARASISYPEIMRTMKLLLVYLTTYLVKCLHTGLRLALFLGLLDTEPGQGESVSNSNPCILWFSVILLVPPLPLLFVDCDVSLSHP